MSWKQIYTSNFFIVNVIRCARTRRSSGRLSAGLSAMSRLMKIPNMRRYFTDPLGRKGFCVWSLRGRKGLHILLALGVKGDGHPANLVAITKGCHFNLSRIGRVLSRVGRYWQFLLRLLLYMSSKRYFRNKIC